jgi:hypothetical protein
MTIVVTKSSVLNISLFGGKEQLPEMIVGLEFIT